MIIIKFGYNALCHCLKEQALSEYKAWSRAKAVTPSAKLYYVRPSPGRPRAFCLKLKVKFRNKRARK